MGASIAVYLETGAKRTFAGGIDWPGWCRSGRSEDEALDALAAYAGRYAAAIGEAVPFDVPGRRSDLDVAERLEGGSGTDFGVPGEAPDADRRPIDQTELERLRRILDASWRAFETASAAAVGRELRTGPRGGGRSLVKMRSHVAEAEVAYVKQLGARLRWSGSDDPDAQVAALRRVGVAALTARARGEPVADPSAVKKPWLPRYFVRRSAWHILDHAWELGDRVI